MIRGPEYLSYEDRVGLIQPGEDSEETYCSLPSPKGKMDRDFFQVHVVRTRGNDLNWERVGLDQMLRESSLL